MSHSIFSAYTDAHATAPTGSGYGTGQVSNERTLQGERVLGMANTAGIDTAGMGQAFEGGW
ncbi:hypothetical protein [Nocardia macrotermitis]|uniref:Uncharacterized protein n=1 Tax=Nocardia macrotermitis TaxID=2585198 RepID=A0A7K0CZV8_9NOCA|nr:hypothetical protein [Nocardia macrotermitis]MQY18951.1 hypothetical protein [Nocardia macrotermitis]